MSTRKRNEWLEADLSDDEGSSYDANGAEDSRERALGGRVTKRRKLSSGSESQAESESENPIALPKHGKIPGRRLEIAETVADDRFSSEKLGIESDDDYSIEPEALDTNQETPEEAQNPYEEEQQSDKSLVPRGLSSKHLSITAKALRQSGVIYLSRIPPFLKPSALRTLLAPYAPSGLNRIFLTPESPEAYARRKRSGGNKKRSFVDGWVEFLRKREAKACVELLNGQIIGGRKGGWYHDDVWSMKYLRTFKWNDLVEAISNENAERNARMRAEIAQSTRANREYAANVERARTLDGIERKREIARIERQKEGSGNVAGEPAAVDLSPNGKTEHGGKRHFTYFRQNAVKLKSSIDKSSGEQPEQVKRVLSKIF